MSTNKRVGWGTNDQGWGTNDQGWGTNDQGWGTNDQGWGTNGQDRIRCRGSDNAQGSRMDEEFPVHPDHPQQKSRLPFGWRLFRLAG